MPTQRLAVARRTSSAACLARFSTGSQALAAWRSAAASPLASSPICSGDDRRPSLVMPAIIRAKLDRSTHCRVRAAAPSQVRQNESAGDGERLGHLLEVAERFDERQDHFVGARLGGYVADCDGRRAAERGLAVAEV